MTQNAFTILLKSRRMLPDFLAVIGFSGPGLEKTPEASMILQLVTESGHPVFRASSAFERGELEKREYGKNSTRLWDNDRNMELLLRTRKSVNQLSIYEFIAHWSKKTLTMIHLKVLHPKIQTAQEHFMQYRYWKQDDYKKKNTMSYENVSDYKTSRWRKQSSSTNNCIRANKCVKIRISNSKEVKIMTTLLIGKQDGNCTKSSRETCCILRLRRQSLTKSSE